MRCMCAWPTRASASVRLRQGQLPQHPRNPVGRGDHRRRGDPSRLRVPVGECRLRRDGGGARPDLHRPVAGAYPHDGRQGRRQGRDGATRRAAGARLRRRGDGRREGPRGCRPHRLSGADQGRGRRRRTRHEGGAERRDAGGGVPASRAPRHVRHSATTPCISRSISTTRGISNCRCSPMRMATSCISASATAACSGVTRSCWRRPVRRR